MKVASVVGSTIGSAVGAPGINEMIPLVARS